MEVFGIKNKTKLQEDEHDFGIINRRDKQILEAWKKGAPITILALEFQLTKDKIRKIISNQLRKER